MPTSPHHPQRSRPPGSWPRGQRPQRARSTLHEHEPLAGPVDRRRPAVGSVEEREPAPRIVEERHVIDAYGDERHEVVDDHGRRFWSFRPSTAGRYDWLGYGWFWWTVAWIAVVALIVWGWGWGW